jgi:hypothetical protein
LAIEGVTSIQYAADHSKRALTASCLRCDRFEDDLPGADFLARFDRRRMYALEGHRPASAIFSATNTSALIAPLSGRL